MQQARSFEHRARMLATGVMACAVALMGCASLGGAGPAASVGAASPDAAKRVTVDCSAGQSLQSAVDHTLPGQTILVSGACSENLFIREEITRVTLDGQRSASIHGPNPALATITILGRGITIKDFSLTGGEEGVAVWRGGTALIDGNTIERTAALPGTSQGGQGINVAQHSFATIIGNTIQDNPTQGIVVHEGSFARIGVQNPNDRTPHGNVIRRNGMGGGVRIQRSSGARIGANIISDNVGPGVVVSGSSHAAVSANQIDNNGGDAISVTGNSSLQLGGDLGVLRPANQTSVPNHGLGVRCSFGSSVVGRLGTLAGVAGVQNIDTSCSADIAP